MSIQKVEMSVEQKENGQIVEYVAYPYVEYDHVTMENGMDIMSMIRDDVSTPTVTHDTSSWKAGQGDSDVSDSIVDSSVASMTIKGQTYQNILPSPTLRNSMTDGNTMQKINEGYDSVEVVDGNVKSAILKGQTLVNLVTNQYEIKPSWNTSKDCVTIGEKEVTIKLDDLTKSITVNFNTHFLLKPNTKYIIVGNVTRTITETASNLAATYSVQWYKDNTYKGEAQLKAESRYQIFTTGDDFNILYVMCYARGFVGEVNYNFPMIFEYQEGMENWDIPYFTGMQSVKMPVLTTTGKNLMPINSVIPESWSGDNLNHKICNLKLKPNTSYTFSNEFDGVSNTIRTRIYDDNNTVLTEVWGNQYKTFTTNTSENYWVLAYDFGNGNIIEGIQIEEGAIKTSYEPYKSNILSTSEDVELRGIGDVQDELNLLTGEVTERIGEIVLDGSEGWWHYKNVEIMENTFCLSNAIVSNILGKGVVISNSYSNRWWHEMVSINPDKTIGNANNKAVYIIDKSCSTLEEFTNYLQQRYINGNPVIIQYPLETESVKTVGLSILDQDNQPTTQLNSFANGYIQVSSQGLIPTTEYEVPTSNSYYVDLMKANTQYTMKNMQGTFTIDGIQYNASVNGTFTTPSTLTNKFMVTSVVQTQPMLLEGDMTSKEVPYVEGIKSAFEGADKVEIVSQNADNTLSNTTLFQLSNPLRSLPNGVRDEIVLDRQNHKVHIIQRVGEDLTQLDTPIITEVNLEGYPYVYKGGHIFLNTEIAPITEVTYSINQAHQIESSNEDILRHQKEINHLYELIAQYVQVQYEAELIDIALQG